MRDKKGGMTGRKEVREDLRKRERKEKERKIKRGRGISRAPVILLELGEAGILHPRLWGKTSGNPSQGRGPGR